MERFASIDNLVLIQNTCNCFITYIGFNNCLQGCIDLGVNGTGKELYLELVARLLLVMSTTKSNIVWQVDKMACFSTVINNKLMIVVNKASECYNFFFLYWNEPLKHGVKFCRIHLSFLTIEYIAALLFNFD